MAFDLARFNEQTYTAITETVAQDVDKFNAASNGTITLANEPAQGDFDIAAKFAAINGLVERRDPAGTGNAGTAALEQFTDNTVKVGSRTKQVAMRPGQYRWVLQNPALFAAQLGTQLAKARTADQLNAGISAMVTSIGNTTEVVNDQSGKSPSLKQLIGTAGKMGDRMTAVKAWVMHSHVATLMYEDVYTNSTSLFTYDDVNVVQDAWGRVFVITDSPDLLFKTTTANDSGYVVGLTPSGLAITGNNDFEAVIEETTGGENLIRYYQAEWSYNVGVKGYKFNTAKAAPTDAEIATAANWTQTATDVKDTAGVLLKVKNS